MRTQEAILKDIRETETKLRKQIEDLYQFDQKVALREAMQEAIDSLANEEFPPISTEHLGWYTRTYNDAIGIRMIELVEVVRESYKCPFKPPEDNTTMTVVRDYFRDSTPFIDGKGYIIALYHQQKRTQEMRMAEERNG